MIIKFESAFEMLKYFYGCYSFLNIAPQYVMVLLCSEAKLISSTLQFYYLLTEEAVCQLFITGTL